MRMSMVSASLTLSLQGMRCDRYACLASIQVIAFAGPKQVFFKNKNDCLIVILRTYPINIEPLFTITF